MNSYKYLSIITGIFTASLIISNVLDTKIFTIGNFAFPAGIILFPIVYLFGDFLTEVYGYNASRKVIWTGFVSLIMMVVFFQIATNIPPAPFWKDQQGINLDFQFAFEKIMGKLPRIAIASVTAFFLGEFTNSYVLAKLKLKSNGNNMPLRFILSTIFGQAVDTSVFVLIAFIGTMNYSNLLTVLISGWLFKVLWEIIALPISIPLVRWLKKEEQLDHFDRNTNFSPFKI